MENKKLFKEFDETMRELKYLIKKNKEFYARMNKKREERNAKSNLKINGA